MPQRKRQDGQRDALPRFTRRDFLKLAGGTVGAVALASVLPRGLRVMEARASVSVPQTPLPGRSIAKYVEPVPTFVGARVDAVMHPSLTIDNTELQEMILPASTYAPLPSPYNLGTYVWGYEIKDTVTDALLGPRLYPAFTIEAAKDSWVAAKYANSISAQSPLRSYLTVDQTLHWANPLGLPMDDPARMQPYAGPTPVVTHLHGAVVQSTSDGGPDAWFTPGYAVKGPAFDQGVTDLYSYPNSQEAATLFYHDHVLGATRLNLYAGLVGFWFVRDAFDTGAPGSGLNLPAGPYEIELAIQDKMFDTNGQLIFPDGDPEGLNGPPPDPEVHPFWNPEFFGDTIVVNGKSWPFLDVEPRRYRFRMLNGCNSRFLDLAFDDKTMLWVIGTDGGLLDEPVQLPSLLLAPGERADVVVDFASHPGANLILKNSAKAPYPKGAPPDPQTVRQVMQFRIGLDVKGGSDPSFDPAAAGARLRGGEAQPPAIVRLVNPAVGELASNVTASRNRLLTLIEIGSESGPLEVLVNNTKWDGTLSPNAGGITETPRVGSTEVWELVNLTADAHPMHLHLTQFQVVNRQPFQASRYFEHLSALYPATAFNGETYPGGTFIPEYGPPLPYGALDSITGNKLGGNPDVTPYLQGKPSPPPREEAGWKDTFKAYPGEVLRLAVRWAIQDASIEEVNPGTNTYPFDPSVGPGYVWHCHIVDHEDNEMMRPYVVTL